MIIPIPENTTDWESTVCDSVRDTIIINTPKRNISKPWFSTGSIHWWGPLWSLLWLLTFGSHSYGKSPVVNTCTSSFWSSANEPFSIAMSNDRRVDPTLHMANEVSEFLVRYQISSNIHPVDPVQLEYESQTGDVPILLEGPVWD